MKLFLPAAVKYLSSDFETAIVDHFRNLNLSLPMKHADLKMIDTKNLISVDLLDNFDENISCAQTNFYPKGLCWAFCLVLKHALMIKNFKLNHQVRANN